MDPGRTVEMPPRGADLSFLNGSTPSGSHPISSGLPSAGAGGHDTPSRWLTFGTTPNGNVTPGTAFGSPFWASLSQSKTSPKTYSPSKELNPFELSFFPKADTLAGPGPSVSAGAARRPSKDQGTERAAAVKQEEIDEEQQGLLRAEGGNPLRTSLKRSLPEGSNAGGPSANNGGDNGAGNGSLHASVPASFAPSWKRPKFDTYHDSSASSSELGLNGSSPAVGGPSPETGSPASSMVPTPNIQSAILPSRPGRKDSQPMEQLEAAKLGRSLQPSEIHVPVVSAHGAHAPAASSTANATVPGYQLTQSAPQPLPSMFGRSATSVVPPSATRPAFAYSGFSSNPNLGAPAAPLQSHLLPAGVSGLPVPGQAPMHPHVQHQMQNQPRPPHQAQAQPAPIILPAKTAAQVQQQMQQQQGQPPAQASAQPPAAAAPGSTAPPASASVDGGAPQLKMQAIPYANGRAPSNQPSSNKAKGGRTRGKAAEAAKAENDGRDAADASQSRRAGSATVASKKGGKKEDNRKASLAPPEPEPDMEADGMNPDEDFGEGEEGEERKRKAFLERNRQAACRSRQKKKEWIGNLEAHAAHLQNQNQHLTSEIDQLRKEMFALRHTLSFHERCGCPNIGDWLAREGPAGAQDLRHPAHAHMQSANAQGIASLLSASGVPPPPPPHIQHLLPQHHAAQQMQAQAAPVAHLQQPQRPTAPIPMASTLASGSPEGSAATPASMHSQAPTPAPSGPLVTARQPSEPGAAPVMVKTGSTPGNRAMAPPASINLSTSSLRPQVPVLAPTPSSFTIDGASINRPGSAGARFGLSTPNFADLFGDSMGRFPGMSTPGAGPPTMSPALPNTFGLSLNDIPVRPASAPPTPSPAIDARLFAPNADYFSAKNFSHHHGGSTPNMFGDLLAGLNSNSHSLMA